MSTGMDPAVVESAEDLVAAFGVLRQIEGRRLGKERLSVQDLARRLERCPHDAIPRSTLANYLSGRTLPPPGPYEAILRALGIPEDELRAWADAWDRVRDARGADARPAAEPASAETGDADVLPAEGAIREERSPGAVARRRLATWTVVAALTAALAGGVTVAVLVVNRPAAPADSGSAASAGECAYSPVAAPIRVRPRPSFGTGTEFHTINSVTQVVIGACEPRHAEAGTTCSAQVDPLDTWIPVRFPYTGWVFSACLQRIAPPSSTAETAR